MSLCDKCAADCHHAHAIEPGEVVVQCGAYKPPLTNTDRSRAESPNEIASVDSEDMEMSRQKITESLSKMLEKYIDPDNDPRIYWAREVTFDYGTGASVRVDYMRFKPVNNSVSGIEKGDFYCYEIKSSVEDFHSKNGHNFIGDLNYYVMPKEVFEAVTNIIPYSVGVLIPKVYGGLQMAKKPWRKDRSRPASEMLLMMWRSSRREIVKNRKQTALEAGGEE